MSIKTEDVKLKVDGTEMPAYVAIPDGGGQHPAVIVFEEIFGVNKHIREVTERLAREGYVVIAPDYHHRAWPAGTQMGYTPEEMQKGMQVIPKLSAEGITADINATIAYLRTRKEANVDRLGAIGFCIGGHAAYFAAATQPVKATASFYGGGIASFGPGGTAPTVTRSKDIKGKIVCFFGADDPMIPQDQVKQIEKALADNKVRHEVVVYPNASHAFFCEIQERGSYREGPAKDAWERVKKLFAAELKG
jgi:carboxymethylenebutenolidase